MFFLSVVSFFSCISSFPEKELIDNPNDDYDNDGLTEVDGDCDDNDEDIKKIVWYVDGDGDEHVGKKISQARKSDASLEERIYKFQLANTVMLKHVQENKSMPDEFYNELRKRRLI